MTCPTCGYDDVRNGECPVCGTRVGNNNTGVNQNSSMPEMQRSVIQNKYLQVNNNNHQYKSSRRVLIIIIVFCVVSTLFFAVFLITNHKKEPKVVETTAMSMPTSFDLSVTGKWLNYYDASEFLNDIVKVDGMFNDVTVPVVWRFEEDGTFLVGIDNSQKADLKEEISSQYYTAVVENYNKSSEEGKKEINNTIYEAGYNDFNSFSVAVGDEALNKLEDYYEYSGYYRVSGKLIYISDSKSGLDSSNKFFAADYEGLKLVLKSYSGDDYDFGTFPLTLEQYK